MSLDKESTELFSSTASGPPLQELSPAAARQFELTGPRGISPEVASSRDQEIPSADGTALTVRIITPGPSSLGVIVFFHGGGWVLGSLEEYEPLCRELANRSGCSVVMVDYRLAPESQFPAAVDDSWCATRWVSENLAIIAEPDSAIYIAGDSAGGNLAAVIAQRAAMTGEVTIARQILIYPITDSDLNRPSYLAPENQRLLTRELMKWFWAHYAPEDWQRRDVRSVPLHGALFQLDPIPHLSPAIVVSCTYDVLIDEIDAYVSKLQAAGIPVTRRHYEDQMHGFITLVNVLPGAIDAVEFIADYLRSGEGK